MGSRWRSWVPVAVAAVIYLWPTPMYFGSGYIGRAQFWKLGLWFGLVYFAGLVLVVYPWLIVLRH